MSEKHHNPNEQLTLPKWITAEYFEPIVAKDIKEFKRIVTITPVAATQPGENFLSIMARVFLEIELRDGKTREVVYILKTTLETASGGVAVIDSLNLFPREKQMYESILPTIGCLYKEAGVEVSLHPRCCFIESLPERTTLVLEDLKERNFRDANRLKGLDMPHMRCVLRMLAELHAASAVQYELNGTYGKLFEQSMLIDMRTNAETESVRREAFAAAMRAWPLDNIEYFIKAIPTSDEYYKAAESLYAIDSNDFNVLNHGDCKPSNIMFRYNEAGEVSEARFVDFQISKWGSPAQDLWYFIVTSAALDIKVKEFDNFIIIYHERLVECLKVLRYRGSLPTLKELHIQLLKYGFWGMFTAAGVLQVVLLPPEEGANMENLLKTGPEGEAFRMRLFTNSYYVRAMCELLPFFQKRGLLSSSQ